MRFVEATLKPTWRDRLLPALVVGNIVSAALFVIAPVIW